MSWHLSCRTAVCSIRIPSACFFFWLCLPGSVLLAQDLSSSQPNAAILPTVQQAIRTMGGSNALAYSGAETHVALVATGRSPISSIWIEDWSGNKARYRREFTVSRGTITTTNKLTQKARRDVAGKSKVIIPDYDLIGLAESFPGVALQLALNRSDCTFQQAKEKPGLLDVTARDIELSCVDPLYHGGRARLIWRFGADCLPLQVQLPILAPDGRVYLYETVQFTHFTTVQGVVVPQEEELVIAGKSMQQRTFSSTAFMGAFPESTFSIK